MLIWNINIDLNIKIKISKCRFDQIKGSLDLQIVFFLILYKTVGSKNVLKNYFARNYECPRSDQNKDKFLVFPLGLKKVSDQNLKNLMFFLE